MSVAVLGGGAFGTALAIALAQRHRVSLWARDEEHVEKMRVTRENRAYLPGIELPRALEICADIPDRNTHNTYLLCVPMQSLRPFLIANSDALSGAALVACCKGLDLETKTGPVALIRNTIREGVPAVLTGPSFAADIARGKPTALTLACESDAIGHNLQHQLTTPGLRLYRTTDTIGAELGGALKNVIAIAAGAAIGAGLGDSARAAVITRGFAEMQRFAQAQGAQPETLAGLSGFGDLVLTCTSAQSRNFRYGHALGAGEMFDSSITVEGAATARAILGLAEDMPITQAVVDVMDGCHDVSTALQSLLERPLKEE